MLSPVVIGATGGSGTRAVRAVLAGYGAHMGSYIAGTGDALDFFPFYDHHINPTLKIAGRLDYRLEDLPPTVREPALASFSRCLAAYRGRFDPAPGPWGFKNPRSMYMLPYLHRVIPDLAFLHILRDGRDISLSRTQTALHLHYAALFGEAPGPDIPLAAARLWAKANGEVADWCAEFLPRRYLMIRFEDLCQAPARTMAAILDFLEWSYQPGRPSELAAGIVTPDSIGRWNSLPAERKAAVQAAAAPTLKRFGYPM